MEFAAIVELIPTLGFPIVCVLGLGWFIYKIYNDSQKEKEELAAQNAANMQAVQDRCQEREDKLYAQLDKQTEYNGQFALIIQQHDMKLDTIQKDIDEIKTDVNIIMNK